MIDTNKYEGHTPQWNGWRPERWTVDEEDPCRVVDVQDCTIARTDFIDIEEEREWQLANARLIADAPLLLEEVNRLRAVMIYVEQRQPHPALEMALKQGLYLSEIRERMKDE